MKNLILFAVLFASVVIGGCIRITHRSGDGGFSFFGGPTKVRGSGVVITETRPLADFHSVSVSHVGRVEFVRSEEPLVTITTDDNLLEEIRTEVSQGRLKIGVRPSVQLDPSDDVAYVVHYRSLDRVSLSGVIQGTFEDVRQERLVLELSGATTLEAEFVEVASAKVDISGASKLVVTGNTKDLSIDASGATHVRGRDLKSDEVHADISGASQVEVWATEYLEGDVSGAAALEYFGRPRTSVDVSGAGRTRDRGRDP